jgi:hypothetical protein
MTKSSAEREKEGHMTRKFLMTVAIVAIALAPSIGIGPAQAHGLRRLRIFGQRDKLKADRSKGA